MIINYASWEYKKRGNFANKSEGNDVTEIEFGATKN
jgi:hypothetical protein